MYERKSRDPVAGNGWDRGGKRRAGPRAAQRPSPHGTVYNSRSGVKVVLGAASARVRAKVTAGELLQGRIDRAR